MLFGKATVDWGVLGLGGLVAALAITMFVRARSWMDVAMIGWLGVILVNVRQSYAWYPVAVVPWLVSTTREKEGARLSLLMSARVLV